MNSQALCIWESALLGLAVLLVPAVVNEEVSYEDAMERSREGIEELLKTAEKLKGKA